MRRPTRRTHFNPTAWTALWNRGYLENPAGKTAREQRVHVLGLYGEAVYRDKLDHLHFERDLGILELSPNEVTELTGGSSTAIVQYGDGPREETLRDGVVGCIEDLFTQAERGRGYQTVYEVVRKQSIDSLEERVAVAVFAAFQHFRTPENIRRLVEAGKSRGLSKLDVYRSLFELDLWDGPFAKDARVVASRQWVLHVAQTDCFPLPDRPILRNPTGGRIWLPLSPRLLLEINTREASRRETAARNTNIKKSLLRHYQSLAIRHTVQHVIFEHKDLLEMWRDDPEWRRRVEWYRASRAQR